MNKIYQYIKTNTYIFILYSILICVLYYIAIFFLKIDSPIFSVQYFIDYINENNSIYPIAYNIIDQISFSLYTPYSFYISLKVLVVIVPIFLLTYFVYFSVVNRKVLKLYKILLLLLITAFFACLYVFSFVFLPAFSLFPLISYTENKIINNVEKSTGTDYVTNKNAILKYIDSSNESLILISDYGKYNLSLKEVYINNKSGRSNYYNILIIPSVAKKLALENGIENNVDLEPLIYYPKENLLIINNLHSLHSFLEKISLYKISALGYDSLNTLIKKKGTANEFKIVNEDFYSEYYIKKSLEINNDIIRKNDSIFSANKRAIDECYDTIQKNEKVMADTKADYEKNCVLAVNYNNCPEFKAEIDRNDLIRVETYNSCQLSIAESTRFNSEIIVFNNELREHNEEIMSDKNIERNKAEMSVGVFLGPSSIVLKNNINPYSLLSVSIHEYLHYIVSSGNRNLPPFFDEAMTDYLNLKALGYDEYTIALMAGYYAEIQILYSLFEKIPFDNVLNVYISGNENEFKSLFEKYFPNSSYESFKTKSEDVYKSTYSFGSKERVIDYLTPRSYLSMEDIISIRKDLGLEDEIVFSELYNIFNK